MCLKNSFCEMYPEGWYVLSPVSGNYTAFWQAARQEIYREFLRIPRSGERSVCDLLHFPNGFEIKMNFDRNVSCFVAVYGFMDNDFFNQAVQDESVQPCDVLYFCMDFIHCHVSMASRILPARRFLHSSAPAFNSACSFCFFSIRRLKFPFDNRTFTCVIFYILHSQDFMGSKEPWNPEESTIIYCNS